MPDKLTDTEIKKALECCIIDQNCKDCPYYENGKIKIADCLENACELALDLINRLQTENESLTRQLNNAKLHQKETHKALQDEKALRLNEDFIKAEAYKECIEKAKELLCQENKLYVSCVKNMLPKEFQKGYEQKNDFVIKLLDNLLNELVGDKK